MTTAFMTVKGQDVTLLGWRALTPINLLVLVGLIGVTLVGLFLGLWQGGFWWYICGGAGIVLAYGIWTVIASTKTKILFADGSLSINGQRIGAAVHGPFYFTSEESADGIDDRRGGNALWLKSQYGDAVFVAMMSVHADTDAIGRCLNDLLNQCKAA